MNNSDVFVNAFEETKDFHINENKRLIVGFFNPYFSVE
jgi:hypothetical protein